MVRFKNEASIRAVAAAVFRREKKRIRTVVPRAQIEHVGSTAIPDSLTKGDLDLHVRVAAQDFPAAVRALSKLYQTNKGNPRTKIFASFKQDGMEIPLGIQLTVRDSEVDDNFNFTRIRDFLLVSPRHQRQYDALKRKFDGQPMREYRKAKHEFFEKIKRSRAFQRLMHGPTNTQ